MQYPLPPQSGYLCRSLRLCAPAALLGMTILAGSSAAHSQSSAAAPASTTAAQTPLLGPAFEVATVRSSNTSDRAASRWYGIEITPSGRLNASSMSLSSLVHYAYVHPDTLGKVQGGPSWVDSEHFDITAKVDDSQLAGWDHLSSQQRNQRIQPMLRELLQERFHLKLHSEMHEESVYALVQVKSGTKLQKVDMPDESSPQSMADIMRENAIKSPDKARPGSMMMTGNGWQGTAVKVSALTGQIAYESHAGTFVVDQTGLDGYYNFSMKIDRSKDAPDFQDQLEQQLGLKLVPRKMPIQTWIIDSADKPSQDGAGTRTPPLQPDPATLVAGYSGGPTVTTK
jgi:uncharacterized protein (TIGR03435 family)